ncbi:hypothetical protein H0O03_02560, partial [Candidatus Micrarchaeota archaeon]|nr:hypothetical protein [Candidatus Micrarchaeota archaeon]
SFFAKHFKSFHFPLVATAFFALLPDLVDKPLFLLGLAPSSRFIAHTIFFGLVVAAILLMVLPKQTRLPIAAAALLGSWSHLLLDVNGPLPLFFPLLSYVFPPYDLGLEFNAATILFELIGFSCVLLVILESD